MPAVANFFCCAAHKENGCAKRERGQGSAIITREARAAVSSRMKIRSSDWSSHRPRTFNAPIFRRPLAVRICALNPLPWYALELDQFAPTSDRGIRHRSIWLLHPRHPRSLCLSGQSLRTPTERGEDLSGRSSSTCRLHQPGRQRSHRKRLFPSLLTVSLFLTPVNKLFSLSISTGATSVFPCLVVCVWNSRSSSSSQSV